MAVPSAYEGPKSLSFQVKFAEGELQKMEAKLFVGMLPKDVTSDGLLSLFSPFGRIIDSAIMRDKLTSESRGCAFVKFEVYVLYHVVSRRVLLEAP